MPIRQASATLLVSWIALASAGLTNAQPAVTPPAAQSSGQAAPTPAAVTPPVQAADQAASPTAPEAPAEASSRQGLGKLAGADVAPASIEGAELEAGAPAAKQAALLIKLQVLLDRAHNSPGVIDGLSGPNFTKALAIFETQHHLPTGLDAKSVAALEAVGGGSILGKYVITAEDQKGPFIGHLPSDIYAQSKLGKMGYTSPEQEISERFHMSPGLIEALNPDADFSKAGTTLTVVRPHSGGLGAKVARIEVDKAHDEVLAYGADDTLVASFPSTIGSVDHPAPDGGYTVAYIRPDPTYTYDPKVLTWGPKDKGRFTIEPGPNNPVGVVWIGLSKPTYGIHGSPNAELIGKSSSHGCVRLTNWDAWDLGVAVKRGAKVQFTGDAPAKT
jgi:lipoprotein-anchoring transpeptidase ErfK/SrfK